MSMIICDHIFFYFYFSLPLLCFYFISRSKAFKTILTKLTWHNSTFIIYIGDNLLNLEKFLKTLIFGYLENDFLCFKILRCYKPSPLKQNLVPRFKKNQEPKNDWAKGLTRKHTQHFIGRFLGFCCIHAVEAAVAVVRVAWGKLFSS